MIRAETDTHWLLVTHPDHAVIAGQFADAWGNDRFARPEPFTSIRHAVYHHDDGWKARDATPSLTPAGLPEAFTAQLVGAYSAFEEINLPDYLAVRGAATAAVADEDLYAGIVVSMHTVNLLTKQARLETIRPEHRAAHASFVREQEQFQHESRLALGADPADLQRGFEFLQACDSLSLIVCSGFAESRPLRHEQPDRTGQRHPLQVTPIESGHWRVDPWPFREPTLSVSVPMRRVAKSACASQRTFREAFSAANVESACVTVSAA